MPDPIGIGLGAVQTLGGLAQTFFSGKRKAERNLENAQSPTYTPNQSINDYYKTALNRYNVNPYSSALYKMQTNNIGKGVATGISSLADRRGGLAGISNIIQGQDDALLKAGVTAEEERNKRFSQLGTATTIKAGEDRKAFDINELQPFERKYNLLAQKASAANATKAAGLNNIFSGISTIAGGLGSSKKKSADNAALGY